MTFGVATSSGVLDSSETNMYAPPIGCKSYVKNIMLRNTGGATETVQLYLYLNDVVGDPRSFPQIVLGADESAVVESFGIMGGDIIKGLSTNPDVVDFVVSAVEEVS